jgi:hypothetical protein
LVLLIWAELALPAPRRDRIRILRISEREFVLPAPLELARPTARAERLGITVGEELVRARLQPVVRCTAGTSLGDVTGVDAGAQQAEG